MLTSTYNLNMRPGTKPLIVHVSQYDKGESLVFILTYTATSTDISSGVSAEIRGTKPDGNGFSYGATYSYSNSMATVTVTLAEQMTAVAGMVPCEIILTKGSGSNEKQLGTANFYLDVERAALDKDTIPSNSEIRQLVDVIDNSDEIISAGEAATLASEIVQSLVQQASQSAISASTNAENSAQSAQDAAGSAQSAAESAAEAEDYARHLSANVTKSGSQAVITITDKTGTTTASVNDGYSPNVSVTSVSGGHRVSITDSSGTDTFDVLNGITPDYLSIGTVSTLTPGSNATASIGGTSSRPVLNLGIPAGAAGANGQGVPSGGSAGKVLTKRSSTNYDTEWADAPSGLPSGGSSGQVLKKNSNTNYDVSWGNAPSALPSGGSSGQVLKKNSGTDYDVAWGNASSGLPSGGTSGQVLKKNSGTDYDVTWANESGGSTWGSITGTLSDQTDLKNALDAKAPVSTTYTKTDVDSMITAATCLIVDCGTISSLPATITSASVTSDMVVVKAEFGTPDAQLSDLTVTTFSGSITISGTLISSGSTTLKLYLVKSR